MADQKARSDDKPGSASARQALRRRAETIVDEKVAQAPDMFDAMSPEATRRMLRELHVHKLELELQNDELRHATHELAAARGRYLELYDTAPVGYCSVSKSGMILDANLTAASILGVPRDELIKQRISRYILKEDRNIFTQLYKQRLNSDEVLSCELRMVKLDGQEFWASLATTSAPTSGGPPALRVVLSEVTESKRNEEELRMAALVYQYNFEAMMTDLNEKRLLEQELEVGRQRYAALVESSSDGIITVDRNQVIKMMNDSAKRIFGITIDAVAGESLSRLLPQYFLDQYAQDADTFGEADVDVPEMKAPRPIMGTREDGGQIEVEVSISKIAVGDDVEMTALVRDVSERTRLIAQLTQAASHDSMTGIYNRRHGANALNVEIQRCRRFDRNLTIAMFDIDRFKGINDTYGHACGDAVLNAVVATILNTLREADALCRWGGDEFLVLLPETKLADAVSWAERARAAVAALEIPGAGQNLITVTASFGLATLANMDETPEEILWEADKALYRAKEGGRNQVFARPDSP
ncbi:hypothetical protein BH11PSE11_BH11PSE11_07600 [soil metagenome]